MDFSKVTNITIPQGNVTKITDASGKVLWQKIEETPLLLFTGGTSDISICNNTNALFHTVADNAHWNQDGECHVALGVMTGDGLIFTIDNITAIEGGTYTASDFVLYFNHNDGSISQYTCSTVAYNGVNVVDVPTGMAQISIELTFNEMIEACDGEDLGGYPDDNGRFNTNNIWKFSGVLKVKGTTLLNFGTLNYNWVYLCNADMVGDRGWSAIDSNMEGEI